MKELIKKPLDINKIEFWAVTTMYVFAVFLLVSRATQGDTYSNWSSNSMQFHDRHLEFSYFSNYFIPELIRYSVFYGLYLLLVYSIIPPIIEKKRVGLNILLILILFITLGAVFGITDTWIKGYLFADYKNREEVYEMLFKANFVYSFWLLMVFAFFIILKFTAIHYLENQDKYQVKNQLVNRDAIIASLVWMISFFLMLISGFPEAANALYGFIVPFSIGLYWYSLHTLIPQARLKKKEFRAYLLKVVLIMVVSIFPLSLLIYAFMNHDQAMFYVNLFNLGVQLLITAPLSWYVYKQRLADNYELTSLKTALGKSSANLDFLRSQINPHFLFNALNTLYGTALQENAERTGEGIQKLGDMMRFMLEENMQEKITLNREIDYINNYIGLQRLRTQSSPDITIQTDIDNQVNTLSITPMLLIPFIENSFKHGISLREPSHIKITLQLTGNGLYFDVYNSIHLKFDNDPEKNKSGIGLNNVKQRLQLLYPNRHELIIRENAKEFFVHLTIQL
ncbi:MAG: histidine kinase [Chitinophagaceae bacterium]